MQAFTYSVFVVVASGAAALALLLAGAIGTALALTTKAADAPAPRADHHRATPLERAA
jgi:hypothetical protein